jgi:hypothetical protein
MSSTFRRCGAALFLLVLIGLGLRVQNLEQKGLWADELFTLAIAQYYPLAPVQGQPLYRQTDVLHIGDGDTFLTAKAAEQSPPLNDLLEKASVNVLGPTELASRLPAAVAAVALLFWFAWFAWRHPDPYVRRVLVWSLLLLVFYPALIFYANDARPYSIGASTVGMAGLLWMLRWRDGWRAWQPPGWTEIGLFTLACYSHYNAAMLVALLLLGDAVLATIRRSRQGWGRLLTLGLIFSVWLALNAHTIVFTSEGRVAWAQRSAADWAMLTLEQAPAMMFPYWLGLAIAVLAGILFVRLRRGTLLWPANGIARLSVLAALTLLYVAFAGVIAAKAGMAHPRYYIFVLPFVAVMMGMVFAEIRQRWLMVGAALILAALAAPAIRAIPSMPYEDFRAMTLYGTKVSDSDTVFLYPWEPNRNTYRVYLERYLGADARSRMVGISSPQDATEVCRRLAGHNNVTVLAHYSGKNLIDSVYAACGERWPQRHREQFTAVFAEHWTAP